MSSPVVIHGAGRMGRELLAHRRARSLPTAAFVDRRARELGTVDGVEVMEPAQAAARWGADVNVVSSIHNGFVSLVEAMDELSRCGLGRVTSIWDYCRETGWLPELPYWMEPGLDWVVLRESAAPARALLADEASVAVFDTQFALRAQGAYRALAPPDLTGEYVPTDLPLPRRPLRLVDCGAYDGDSIRAIVRSGWTIEDVIAYEPDPAQVAALGREVASLPSGTVVAAGTSDETGTRRFSGGLEMASRESADGSLLVAFERIDDRCLSFAPNYIKMDVEGAEAASLLGAKATIERWRPVLGISAYHLPQDLWTLLALIDQWKLGYRFYMRAHQYNGFGVVLYALPQ